MDKIVEKVKKYIKENSLVESGETICLAVSGGADSVALLNILLELKEELKIDLFVCHFDHRQRKESGEDRKFVEDMSQKRGLECISGHLSGKNTKNSEESLRTERYKFFEKILNSNRGVAKIATAHNMNDLSETLLLRIIRGSGTKGLRGILPRRKNFIRPLLCLERKEIEQYLKRKGQTYKIDQSNQNIDFLRNKIRHQFMPEFQKINPQIIRTLAQTATSLTKDYDLIYSILDSSIPHLIEDKTSKKIIIQRKKFVSLPQNLKPHIIMDLLSKISPAKDISSKHLENILELIKKGEGKKTLPLPHSLRITLINDKIYLLNEKTKEK